MKTPKFFTLHTQECTVLISDYGARLLSFFHEGVELLYGPKSVADLLRDDCYCGAICGRVANRIAGGEAQLSDGRKLELPVNNGANHLHGGLQGFSDKYWLLESHDAQRIVFSYTSLEGEEGYTGTLHIRASYSLEGSSLSLDLEAQCDDLTLINLTHHAYWNLDGEGDVLQHRLQVKAEKFTPIVENIPTGEIAEVEGSVFDLRQPALLGERIGEGCPLPLGYDDNYCIQGDSESPVVLENGVRRLTVWSDAPGLQVYTGYYLPDRFGGVALEPQCYPDAPHHPHFPSIELTAGAHYSRHIIWAAEVLKSENPAPEKN